MADLSYLSDTDDSTVEELISQAQDLCVLEQVAAINCSAFTDALLPADLESRFRKLKSFPAVTNNATTPSTGSARRPSIGDDDAAVFSPSKHNPNEKIKTGSTPKSTSGSSSSPLELPRKRGTKGSRKAKSNNFSVSSRSNSSNSSPESAIFSPAKHKRPSKLKSLSRSLSSPFGSCNSLMGSPSPPRKPGCFWCSPKTKSKSIGPNLRFGNDDELLSDLRSFSKKEQTRKLKKALEEEEKICKEAEKVVQWAKQASARMSVIGIEDDLSDD